MQLELDHPTLCLGIVSVADVRVAASADPLLVELARLESALAEQADQPSALFLGPP